MSATLRIAGARVPGRDGTCDIVVADGHIQALEPAGRPHRNAEVLDAGGRVVVPGFVDCHTHACFAGTRYEEWAARLAGEDYLAQLEGGGGIMATVRATRAATEDELAESLLRRLDRMLRHGTTCVEVKSGYGLDTDHELKMLRAIAGAGERFPGTIVPTACIGHAIDPDVDRAAFIRRTIEETLPAVTEAFPGIALDAYCERGAWSLDDALALAEAGREAGHPVRMHADQFNALGMIEAAVERGFLSVDHLEATGDEGLALLAGSRTFGVMLPASGFHVDERYADGRSFLDRGGRLALATNYNPGSAPCPSMPFVIQLAVRRLGLRPEEALVAATRTGAELLGLDDRGEIAPGRAADLVLLDADDPTELAFEFGANPVRRVMIGGEWIVGDHG
ncbi:MAG: imidazolonepropionase [Wenzhouxiangellaceae bacterium]|nr:imidazolonepropionase [Wenzhouxiangellaceae bacterium]